MRLLQFLSSMPEIALRTSAPKSAPPQLFSPKQVHSSGMIFSGTVLGVTHISALSSAGITQITFKVESAMRGTRRGQILQVREWEALWNSGERYNIGQRVFLFFICQQQVGPHQSRRRHPRAISDRQIRARPCT